jgi:hypothetical protein
MVTDAGTAVGPKALLHAGLVDWLREQGHDVAGTFDETLAMIKRVAASLISRFPATLFSSSFRWLQRAMTQFER